MRRMGKLDGRCLAVVAPKDAVEVSGDSIASFVTTNEDHGTPTER